MALGFEGIEGEAGAIKLLPPFLIGFQGMEAEAGEVQLLPPFLQGFQGLEIVPPDYNYGRILLNAVVVTEPILVTVITMSETYQVWSIDGYFPVYEQLETIDVSIDYSDYEGSSLGVVLPAPTIIFDINVTFAAGMAVKAVASVIIPKIDPTALPASASASTLPFCSCDCANIETVFTDEIGTDSYTNDKSSFLYRKYAPADTVSLELWKAGVLVAAIADSTYGDFYDFGGFAAQPNYKGLVLDWFKVWQAFGYGKYVLKTNQVLIGEAINIESRIFHLLPYSASSAHSTVKVESWQTGNIVSNAFDYTDLVEGGWYSSYRFEGRFGFKTPILEVDNYIDAGYAKTQIQDKIRAEYTLESNLLPTSIANVIVYDSMLANTLAISDYNVHNTEKFDRVSVYPTSFEVRYPNQSKKAVYVVKLEEKLQNIIKRNF